MRELSVGLRGLAEVVQEVLGHSQLSTTADIYAHVTPELQRDAADRMGALLDGIERTS